MELYYRRRGGEGDTQVQDSGLLGGIGVFVKKQRNQGFQMPCCRPNTTWDVKDFDSETVVSDTQLAYLKEEAGFIGRCYSPLCPAARPTKYTMYAAGGDGEILATYEKGPTCTNAICLLPHPALKLPWCCCLPYLTVRDADGTVLGHSRYITQKKCCCIPTKCFVPTIGIYDKEKMIYAMFPDVCCCGCCIKPSHGWNCCDVSFWTRWYEKPHIPIDLASITGKWTPTSWINKRGEGYEMVFPINRPVDKMEPVRKLMVGTALLIHLGMYEQVA